MVSKLKFLLICALLIGGSLSLFSYGMKSPVVRTAVPPVVVGPETEQLPSDNNKKQNKKTKHPESQQGASSRASDQGARLARGPAPAPAGEDDVGEAEDDSAEADD